mgnify:CR=1 FL=1
MQSASAPPPGPAARGPAQARGGPGRPARPARPARSGRGPAPRRGGLHPAAASADSAYRTVPLLARAFLKLGLWRGELGSDQMGDAVIVDVLTSLKASGTIGGWGASVHSVRGGQIVLSAGADMLQVPFSILQQEHAALLAQCAVLRKGVLVQSALCQGVRAREYNAGVWTAAMRRSRTRRKRSRFASLSARRAPRD